MQIYANYLKFKLDFLGDRYTEFQYVPKLLNVYFSPTKEYKFINRFRPQAHNNIYKHKYKHKKIEAKHQIRR